MIGKKSVFWKYKIWYERGTMVEEYLIKKYRLKVYKATLREQALKIWIFVLLPYWVGRNSTAAQILVFAFRLNLNTSQDPDSMLNPKQASDFHADPWFVRSRSLKLVCVQCILYEPPYILVF